MIASSGSLELVPRREVFEHDAFLASDGEIGGVETEVAVGEEPHRGECDVRSADAGVGVADVTVLVGDALEVLEDAVGGSPGILTPAALALLRAITCQPVTEVSLRLVFAGV